MKGAIKIQYEMPQIEHLVQCYKVPIGIETILCQQINETICTTVQQKQAQIQQRVINFFISRRFDLKPLNEFNKDLTMQEIDNA
ncbi:MAG: hypothetical protein MJZ53_04150, partial [Paludibacteraceae bacterium]|nr:hypothetical protein [Paludibacteraceae bacterium]